MCWRNNYKVQLIVVILCCFTLFFLFFVHLSFVFCRSILVLLVLRYQIIHVGFSLSEFHLIHTLTSVPMQESLSPEHSSELFADSLEELLDGSAVANECSGHLQSSWWDITDSCLDVVGDPFNEV